MKSKSIFSIVAISAVFLSGCSHNLVVTAETAPKISAWQLCKGLINASLDDEGMQAAMNEMKARKQTCDEWREIIVQDNLAEAEKRRKWGKALQDAGNSFNQNRPVQCFSNRLGNNVQTTCY